MAAPKVVDMSSPKPPTIEALQDWIRESAAAIGARDEFTVKAAISDEFLLLFGPCAQAIRYAGAYTELQRAGYTREAAALGRAAMEHAVTAQWVYLVDGALSRFRSSVMHSRKRFYTDLAEWLNIDEVRTGALRLPSPPGKGMPTFSGQGGIMSDLDQENFLKTGYKVLSQTVHVTHSTVHGFLGLDDKNAYFLKYETGDYYEYQTHYLVAISCMLARWLIGKLTEDGPALTYLDRKSDELYLPCSLEHGIPAHKLRVTG